MSRATTFLCLLFLCPITVLSWDPDQERDAPELIASRGFICETHEVTTRDGYVLGVHRIINPRIATRGRPVMVQHGLLSSGRDFIVNSPGGGLKELLTGKRRTIGNNLGFELAIEGHDVWLTNSRGNTYSRKHRRMSPKDKAFWDFTFDEMIKFDVPDTIDYILKSTNRSSLAYVGHSQGTLIMFGLLSTRPEYNDIVKPYIALSPITSVGYIKSPLRHVAKLGLLRWFAGKMRGEFLPSNYLMKAMSSMVCKSVFKPICSNIMFMIFGYNEAQLNMTRLAVYTHHTPAGTSTMNMLHFSQNINSKRFQAYDYGCAENERRYRAKEAPEYDLGKITNEHMAFFTSDNDWLSQLGDLNRLRNKLNVVPMVDHVIPYKNWNHADYIFALQAGKYINSKVLEILKKY